MGTIPPIGSNYVMHPRQWVIVDVLAPIILNHVEGDLVEIGMGGSTNVLYKHTKGSDRTLHSCDINPKKCVSRGANHRVFCGTSESFLKDFNHPIALGIIDGDHSEDTLRMELSILATKEILQSGGVLFCHDTNLYDRRRMIKAFRVKEEYEAHPYYDVFTWPYTVSRCGLTMIAHRDPRGPFYRR